MLKRKMFLVTVCCLFFVLNSFGYAKNDYYSPENTTFLVKEAATLSGIHTQVQVKKIEGKLTIFVMFLYSDNAMNVAQLLGYITGIVGGVMKDHSHKNQYNYVALSVNDAIWVGSISGILRCVELMDQHVDQQTVGLCVLSNWTLVDSK